MKHPSCRCSFRYALPIPGDGLCIVDRLTTVFIWLPPVREIAFAKDGDWRDWEQVDDVPAWVLVVSRN